MSNGVYDYRPFHIMQYPKSPHRSTSESRRLNPAHIRRIDVLLSTFYRTFTNKSLWINRRRFVKFALLVTSPHPFSRSARASSGGKRPRDDGEINEWHCHKCSPNILSPSVFPVNGKIIIRVPNGLLCYKFGQLVSR